MTLATEIDPAEDEASSVSKGTDNALSNLFKGALPEWINPVFVKEVRQAQRGKLFSIALIITLTLAMFAVVGVSLSILSGSYGQPGPMFFSAVYVFLAGAVLVVVPFQAFVSMGSEWDDNTFEMLVLSNLKPRQIVFGKVLAASLQAAMFGLAFLPFVVTAFLLRGVDVAVLGLILGLTAAASFCLCIFTVMVSTLVRRRFLRVVTMVVLAGMLFSLVPGSSAFASVLLNQPEIFSGGEFWIGLIEFLIVAFVGTALCGSVACNMLAHEEENRSTNVRIVLTVTLLLTLAALAFNASPLAWKFGIRFQREEVFAVAVFSTFVLTFFGIFLALEPERLGRRVEPAVPRSKLLAWFVTPWLPGGGRGALFYMTHLLLLLVATFGIAALAEPSRVWGRGPTSITSGPRVEMHPMLPGGFGLLGATLYGMLYVLLPAVVLGGTKMDTARRNLMRAIALLFPLALLFIPSIFGIFIGSRSLQELEHFGNPFQLIRDSWDREGFRPEESFFFVAIIVMLLLFVIARRVLDGVGEVLTASKKNAAEAGEA